MTAQIPDLFRYREEEYHLAGISEGKLFEPTDLGLEACGGSTACWRGYQAIYALVDGYVVLDDLKIGLGWEEAGVTRKGPTIGGRTPRISKRNMFGLTNAYKKLAHRLSYSGGVLLARGFISRLYVHMGFHPAWKYQEVFELVFEEGRLISEGDKSAKMQEVRELLAATAKGPGGGASKEEISEFVERAFDRSY